MENHNKLAEMVLSHQQVLLTEWVDLQMTATTLRLDLMKESELRDQSRELLSHFTRALESGTDITHPSWKDTKNFLAQVVKSRAMQGFSQTETATFVFSLKQPLFGKVRATCTAHDFLDTVIAIFAPTCGSQRSAIGAPRPSVCVVF